MSHVRNCMHRTIKANILIVHFFRENQLLNKKRWKNICRKNELRILWNWTVHWDSTMCKQHNYDNFFRSGASCFGWFWLPWIASQSYLFYVFTSLQVRLLFYVKFQWDSFISIVQMLPEFIIILDTNQVWRYNYTAVWNIQMDRIRNPSTMGQVCWRRQYTPNQT